MTGVIVTDSRQNMATTHQSLLRGVYLITPDDQPFPRLIAILSELLPQRPALLQYRDKRASLAERRTRALKLAKLCRRYGVPLIVNDDPELAQEVGAAGVHLGQEDGSLAWARARLGPLAILGWSCYADLKRAQLGASEGASYLAFGSVFASPTKPMAPRAPLALLKKAKEKWRLPICAIGGIGVAEARVLAALGVDLIATISAVFAAADPLAAFLALQRAFAEGEQQLAAEAGGPPRGSD